MSIITTASPEATPLRPTEPLAWPEHVLQMRVRVDVAHLANPRLALQGVLASEAGLFAQVVGDDDGFDLFICLPGPDRETAALAEAWARWAIHIAGIRGAVTRCTPRGRGARS